VKNRFNPSTNTKPKQKRAKEMPEILKQNDRTALEYLSAARDLSPVLRKEIQSALNIYDLSIQLLYESRQSLVTVINKLNTATNTAHKTVVKSLLENKKPNTEKLIAEIVELKLQVTAAQLHVKTSLQAFQMLKSHATGFYTALGCCATCNRSTWLR
jgi:hypothetical protein